MRRHRTAGKELPAHHLSSTIDHLVQAAYCDPQTGLRYHSAPVYQLIRSFTPETVQKHLRIRNAHTIVK